MKKQEMIDTIQKAEKDADQKLIEIQKIYGMNNGAYELALAEWAGIYRLCQKLQIPT